MQAMTILLLLVKLFLKFIQFLAGQPQGFAGPRPKTLCVVVLGYFTNDVLVSYVLVIPPERQQKVLPLSVTFVGWGDRQTNGAAFECRGNGLRFRCFGGPHGLRLC